LAQPVDPAKIAPFSVILMRVELDGKISEKLFVVLSQQKKSCVCAKATSKVDLYLGASVKKGVVWFQAGELPYFPHLTAIQPDNLFNLEHAEIAKSVSKGEFEVLGPLPAGFKEKFVAAIHNSPVMDPKEKELSLKFTA
jgi:hypothetical protein